MYITLLIIPVKWHYYKLHFNVPMTILLTANILKSSYAVSVQSLWTINIRKWQSLTRTEQDTVTNVISTEIIETINSLCERCGITSDHLINSTFEVIDDSMHSVIGIYYTSYIVYSSPEGDVTASTLVTLLQQWLLEAEENEMQVTVDNARLVIFKFCGLDNNNPNSKGLCLSIWSKSVLWVANSINPSPSNSSPSEKFLKNSQKKVSSTSLSHSSPFPTERSLQNIVLEAIVAFVVGLMTATICTLIIAASWLVEMATICAFASPFISSTFSHVAHLYIGLCIRTSQIILLTTHILNL